MITLNLICAAMFWGGAYKHATSDDKKDSIWLWVAGVGLGIAIGMNAGG